jgi:hypothetical protein
LTIQDVMPLIAKEMQYGYERFGTYHNSHEHYAVLQEEVDEWWDAVKRNTADYELYELIQVAAVALRYVVENGNIQNIDATQQKRHLT